MSPRIMVIAFMLSLLKEHTIELMASPTVSHVRYPAVMCGDIVTDIHVFLYATLRIDSNYFYIKIGTQVRT